MFCITLSHVSSGCQFSWISVLVICCRCSIRTGQQCSEESFSPIGGWITAAWPAGDRASDRELCEVRSSCSPSYLIKETDQVALSICLSPLSLIEGCTPPTERKASDPPSKARIGRFQLQSWQRPGVSIILIWWSFQLVRTMAAAVIISNSSAPAPVPVQVSYSRPFMDCSNLMNDARSKTGLSSVRRVVLPIYVRRQSNIAYSPRKRIVRATVPPMVFAAVISYAYVALWFRLTLTEGSRLGSVFRDARF